MKSDDRSAEIDALNSRAVELSLDGKFTEAIAPAKQAIELAKSLDPKHPALGGLLHNLARLYASLGRYEEAEFITKHEVKVAEAALGPDHPDTALALDSLAGIYTTQARYAEAEELGKRVLAIYERVHGADNLLLSVPLNSLARVYAAQERYEEAETLYKRDLAIIEKVAGADSSEARASLANLAALYERQGKYAAAEPLLRRAVSLAERDIGPDHPQFAVLSTNLAALYNSQGKYASAEPLLERALAIAETSVGTDSQIYANALFHSAALAMAQRRWPQALTALERAANLALARARRSGERAGSTLIGPAEGEPLRFDTALTAFMRAGHRVAELEPARAQALSDEMFRVAQWARGPEAGVSSAQISLLQGKGDARLAGLIRERQDLVSTWQRKDKLLVVARSGLALTRNFATEKALSESLGGIDTRIGEIDRTLAEAFPRYAALINPMPLSIEEARAQLQPGEALVVFIGIDALWQEPEATFVWAVTKDDSRWVRIELGPAALAERIEALRCGLDFLGEWRGENAKRCGALLNTPIVPVSPSSLPFDIARAHDLYEALFGKVDDLIKDKHLLIVPSGALTALPFQALVTAKPAAAAPPQAAAYAGTEWLAKRQAVTVLPSVASLKSIRQAHASAATSPFIGFGNPLLSGRDGKDRRAWERQKCPSAQEQAAHIDVTSAGIDQPIASFFLRGAANLEALRHQPALSETADELCAMARSLGTGEGSVYLGERATERGLKALSADATLSKSRVIHFATHALLAGETETLAQAKAEPALMLTPPAEVTEDDDGLLTASEVTQLKLDADWVIMSASSTAAGGKPGAEALAGLARAFLYAGARAMLVTHWYVSSKDAVSLTTGALEEFKRNPAIGRGEALRRSMLAMMQAGGANAHPANWAAFALVGDGSATATGADAIAAAPSPGRRGSSQPAATGSAGRAAEPAVPRRRARLPQPSRSRP